jgi:phospholipid/cholesterol/gamma-HCH transport system ATP-binding protein
MIEIRDIYKKFGEKEVLKGISTVFETGITNLVIGRSGSGKTVLVKSVSGLEKVTSGEIFYDGRQLSSMNEMQTTALKREIGMVFQGGALFDSMTVAENVRFPLLMFSKLSAAEMDKRVDFCLERVDLPKTHSLYASELSGGMRKRVAIARAIVANPKYLFCDEPNSGLDPQTSILIDKLIKEITEELNITTIINTHDMNSVLEIGEHIVFINNGQLWWEGTRHDVISCDNKELNDFLFNNEITKRLKN